MVRANSLLYAIYICLIVSVLCGGLLYFSTLYTQLNQHYNLREALYVNNQSVINFAMGHKMAIEEIPVDVSGIGGSYEIRPYGLLTLLLARSVVANDTVVSAHLTGGFAANQTALHLANLTRPLAYSGKLSLIGESRLPAIFIETSYQSKNRNELTVKGNVSVSETALPDLNPDFKMFFKRKPESMIPLEETTMIADSVYYNSFFNPVQEVAVPRPGNRIFKGNFILRANDSIVIGKNTILEDVIVIAPKIIFEPGFKGSVQAFATKSIRVGEKSELLYPSVLCLNNEGSENSSIRIAKEVRISGAVVLLGNDLLTIGQHTIEMDTDGLITGDIYTTGRLMLRSNVHGSVYARQVFYKDLATSRENLLADIEINALKRPAHFISIPLLGSKKTTYGIVKKVL